MVYLPKVTQQSLAELVWVDWGLGGQEWKDRKPTGVDFVWSFTLLYISRFLLKLISKFKCTYMILYIYVYVSFSEM